MAVGSSRRLKKLRLLLWKNYLIERRRPLVLLFEFLLPILVPSILVIVRTTEDIIDHPDPTTYSPLPLSYKLGSNISQESQELISCPMYKLAYSSGSNKSLALLYIDGVVQKLPCILEGSLPYETEAELEYELSLNEKSMDSVLCAIVFNEINEERTEYKIRFPYRLRVAEDSENWQTETLLSDSSNGPRNPSFIINEFNISTIYPQFTALFPDMSDTIPVDDFGGLPSYYLEGFLFVQVALDSVIMESLGVSSSNRMDQLWVRRFPYPPYVEDSFVATLQDFLANLLILSFVFVTFNIVKSVVGEKEARLKETMRIMGVENYLIWTSWIVQYSLFTLTIVALTTIFLCVDISTERVLPSSDWSVLFVFILLYGMSSMMLCFLLSTLFSKANVASVLATLIWFLTFLPFLILYNSYDDITLPIKLIASLLCNTGMGLGAYLVGQLEVSGVGAHWHNIADPINMQDDLTILAIMGMLCLDIVLYGLATWYIEAVFPGEFGYPQHPLFFLQSGYWFGSDKVDDIQKSTDLEPDCDPEFIEEEDEGIPKGIEMIGLRKVFDGNKVAVNNLSLNLYEEQITVLLGHNGAGKSTTMSMLTGIYPPTSGRAVVNGYQLTTQLGKVRESLGLCPQHDVLFDQLTVQEHLEFFGLLKSDDELQMREEIDTILDNLQLSNKRNSLSKTLSGGMKRKLSVAIALGGNSRVVILDEPTSGMDPAARRLTWDVLLGSKANRTIMLTTHFMDEADVLGDRIAIMASGRLECVGSSLFLKKKYGVGYQLTVVTASSCDVKQLEQQVTGKVSGSFVERQVGSELVFTLPSEQVSSFYSLFQQMEQNQDQWGIESFGVSVTTIEEVFLRVMGKLDDVDNQNETSEDIEPSATDPNNDGSDSIKDVGGSNTDPNVPLDSQIDLHCNENATKETSGFVLWKQQFHATVVKRVIHTFRNRRVALAQLLIPALCTSFALLVTKISQEDLDSPTREMLLRQYESTVTFVGSGNGSSEATQDLVSSYSQLISDQSHKGSELKTVSTGLEAAIVNAAEVSLEDYNNRMMVAAEFFDDNITVWYNNVGYHTASLSLNLISNAILELATSSSSGTSSTKNHWISVSNHPLPQTIDDTAEQLADVDAVWQGFNVGFNVAFGFAFLVASFVIFPVKERATKSKHLQYVSGLRAPIFWLSAFCWDYANYLVSILVLLFLFAIFRVDAYTGSNLFYISIIFTGYGLAALPMMYSIAFFFEDSVSAFVRCTTLNIVLSIGTLITISLLDSGKSITKTMDWLFVVLIPQYAIPIALLDLYINHESHVFCEEFGGLTDKQCAAAFPDDFRANYFAWERPGVGRYPVFYLIHAVIWWFVLICAESNLVQTIQNKISVLRSTRYAEEQQSKLGSLDDENDGNYSENIQFAKDSKNETPTYLQRSDSSYQVIDEDVQKEAELVKSNLADLKKTSTLVLDKMSKTYYTSDSILGSVEVINAVKDLYLSVSPQECFGLLGVNGAGKTTTFKMLTGDIPMSSGTAYVKGLDISKDIKAAQQLMGYCPQFDALIDQMTGRETLRMFARLRGLSPDYIENCVDELIGLFGLTVYADRQAREYSGGNKRKLSSAIAMIGLPALVFLDEPTTGMDPGARRALWRVILHLVRNCGLSVILTSHSMQECDYLCSRLAIMVNGQFQCLGSPQHLKNRFGQGFTLVAKLQFDPSGDNKRQFSQFMIEKFPNSVLKDEHQTMVQYQVLTSTQQESLKWSELFQTMEQNKEKLGIVDYSVSQTTLEQVFLNFARDQTR